MEIKNILIAIRESNGYSKRTVSEMAGIPYTTYVKYESGERKDVSMYALCKLADFYHVTTDYLLGRPDAKQPADPVDEFVSKTQMKSNEQAALKKWLNLSEKERKAVLDIMAKVIHEYESEISKETDVSDKISETVPNNETVEKNQPALTRMDNTGNLKEQLEAEENAQKDAG